MNKLPESEGSVQARSIGWLRDMSPELALLWAIRIGVVMLFVTPLVVTTGTIFPFVVGKAIWSRSIIEIVVGLYVLLAIRVPEYRPHRSRLVMLLGLHLVAVFIAGVFGSSFNLSFWSSYERMGGIYDLAHWTALAAVLIFTLRDLSNWKTIASISLAFGLGAAFLGLADKYDYEIVDYFQGEDRISGAAGNPSYLAGHMMLNAMLAVALMGDRLLKMRRRPTSFGIGLVVFYAFVAVISLWVLGETGTRGSVIGLIVGITIALALYALFSGRPRLRLVALIFGVVAPTAVILIFIGRDTAFVEDLASRNQFVHRAITVSINGESESLRVIGIRIAGQAFVARPVTGWGGEAFEVPYHRFLRDGERKRADPNLDRAHNKPFDLLATTGLIGFATYLAVWVWLGTLGWRRLREEPANRLFNAMVAGTLVALFIHNLFLFDTAVTLLMFGLFAAWAAAGERRKAPGEIPVEPGQRRQWLPASARRSLRSAAPVLVVVIVVIGVYGINMRTYRAAQLVGQTGANVQEISDNLNHFSPLATFARERLLNIMADRLDEMSLEGKVKAIDQLALEVKLAIGAEPENMELNFAVARFYRAAAEHNPGLMTQARFYTDKGISLGPNTASAALALERQTDAEAELSPAG